MFRYICLFLIFAMPLLAESNSYIIKVKNKNSLPQIYAKSILDESLVQVAKQRKDISLAANTALDNLKSYYVINKSDLSAVTASLDASQVTYEVFENVVFQIEQTDISTNGQWALEQINAKNAWKYATGKGVVVGVVDTGLDYLHKDLKNSIWINTKEDLNGNGKFDAWSSDEEQDGVFGDLNGIDDDGNGFADDVIGYDFVDQDFANIGDYRVPDPIPNDENNHGTKVSGIIAAQKQDEGGMQGLAFDAKLMALRAFDITGNAESDDIARAIVYAAMNGVDVLNFSFGQNTKSPLVEAAVDFASDMGVVISASSGNSGSFYNHYPSDYGKVICVGGTANNGKLYGASNYGSRLDICAPGSLVRTTNVNDSYTETSGTSLSAPHVTAALALLKEKNPHYTPYELKGVLIASAYDYKDDGWDIYTGAGFLDAEAALLEEAPSEIEITSPKYEDGIIKEDNPTYTVKGTVVTPLFDSYSVYLGYGTLPVTWFLINENVQQQIKNGILAEFKPGLFIDSIYTVRLVVNLKNGKTLEQRKYLEMISKESKPQFSEIKVLDGYRADTRVKIVSFYTNRATIASLEVRRNAETIFKVKDTESETQYHLLVLDSLPAGTYNYKITAEDRAGNISTQTKIFEVDNADMPKDKFVLKNYTTRMAYLSNVVADLSGNEKPNLIINDGESLADEKTIALEFDENNTFVPLDSIEVPWAVVGKGDSNGDGKQEIIATNYGRTSIFQESNGKFFENPLFTSNPSYSMWAAGMFDFDNDNKDEVIMYNDTSYFVYEYENGKYKYKTTAVVPEQYLRVSLALGMAVGDFDNDGKVEMAHSDSYGRLYVHEYQNGHFNFEFIDTTEIFPNTVYMKKCDIDGDGVPELILGNHGSYPLYGRYDVGNSVWYYRIYKYDAAEATYKKIWTEHFTQRRAGQIPKVNAFYKNGLAVGELDNKSGEEFVISTFPNLYVFGWDNTQGKIVPKWYYPTAYTVSGVIYDFDKNGVNELGFSNFGRTQFFEYDTQYDGPDVPTGFEAWATSDTSAYLKWNASTNADYYKIYQIIRDGNSAKAVSVDATDKTEFSIDTLKPNSLYEFIIQSVSLTMTDTESVLEDSDIAEVYTHNMIEPDYGEFTDNLLKVKYTGDLLLTGMNVFDFGLKSAEDDTEYAIKQVLSNPDSTLLLTFVEDIPNGNYIFISGVFTDYYGSPSIYKEIEIERNISAEQEEMYLKSLKVLSKGVLGLEFSHKIDNNSAENIENYAISPEGGVFLVEMDQTDSTKVLIGLDPTKRLSAKGINYLLTVTNVIAADGTPITEGAGKSLGFVVTSEDPDENAYVYPNPISIGERPDIFFAELPARCTIDVFRLDGEFVISLEEDDGNGGAKWDGRDVNGSYITPGVYIYRINYKENGSDEVTSTKKFLVKP